MLVVNTVMNDREKNITNRLHTVTEGYKENKSLLEIKNMKSEMKNGNKSSRR